MIQTIEIVLKGVPPSMNKFNGRKNCWEYREAKKYWTNLVFLMGASKRPPRPYNKAVVSILYRFNSRLRRDPDNYAGKFLLDGLTKSRIIVDDSFSHIKLVLDSEDEPGEERTTITVEEVRKDG